MIKTKPNYLIITILYFLMFSCSTQKKNISQHKNKYNSHLETNKKTTNSQRETELTHIKSYDFFYENIGDPTKKNYTKSYGSIVGAKLKDYKVTKSYFPALSQNYRQKFLILHYTVSNNDASIKILTQKEVSAHYLINDIDDEEIYQLVDENKRAYHAGISSWKSNTQLNDTSIGIEIVNEGFKIIDGNMVFTDFPEYQFKKVASLAKDIVDRYQIPPQFVLAHSDISPTRKQDPGTKFPWKRLYTEYQVGMWYDDDDKESFMNEFNVNSFSTEVRKISFISHFQKMLKDFGYSETPINGTIDITTTKIIRAFQYHFRPEKCDGIMDLETYAILQALLKKYGK